MRLPPYCLQTCLRTIQTPETHEDKLSDQVKIREAHVLKFEFDLTGQSVAKEDRTSFSRLM